MCMGRCLLKAIAMHPNAISFCCTVTPYQTMTSFLPVSVFRVIRAQYVLAALHFTWNPKPTSFRLPRYISLVGAHWMQVVHFFPDRPIYSLLAPFDSVKPIAGKLEKDKPL